MPYSNSKNIQELIKIYLFYYSLNETNKKILISKKSVGDKTIRQITNFCRIKLIID